MTKFGEIKSKIEKTGADLFGKNNFQKFMVGFKSNILENKDLSEIFYIYEDLSTKKGLHKIKRSISDNYFISKEFKN